MKKFSLFAVASLLLLATGCSESDNLATDSNNAIEFRSVVDKSRASLIDNVIDLESFFVVGLQGTAQSAFMSASVYREGTTVAPIWTYSPKKYWPTNGETVNFYAFAPYSNAVKTSLVASGASPAFSYTVPNNQSVSNTAVDLLVAKASGSTTTGTTAVNIPFKHALSAATFSAKNSNPVGSELIYTISKIELTYLDNVGTYGYASETWTPNTNRNITYTAGVPASGVAVQPGLATAVNLLSANDVMMVLPQTPTASAKIQITYGLTDGEGAVIYPATSTKVLDFPASFEFEQGTRYNFTFSFDASNAITFKVSVEEWGIM